MKKIDPRRLVSLDESSVNLAYSRLYGRALTTERVKEGQVDVRFERESILSTIRLSGSMVPIVFKGTLNRFLFAEYIKTQLKPTLAEDDILLLDNSSVHTSKLVKDTLRDCDINYMYLPRYSPDFNPIELLWALMKSYLRKAKARTRDKLDDAIKHVLDSVPLLFIEHWFFHCGYVASL